MIQAAARGITVRWAARRDLADIVRIERESFSDPWTADSFEQAMWAERMRVLVAEEQRGAGAGGTTLVGYVLALQLGPEGEIADLAVAPDARRRGVGGALLDRISVELQGEGVRALFLEVRESNAAARALYESRGFAPVGRRRGYYLHPREDALLLRRDLAQA
jgi:ribosomal-protein-alanine N-acetyltransferase